MEFEKTNQCRSKIDEYFEWLNEFPEDHDEIQYRFDLFKAELNSIIEKWSRSLSLLSQMTPFLLFYIFQEINVLDFSRHGRIVFYSIFFLINALSCLLCIFSCPIWTTCATVVFSYHNRIIIVCNKLSVVINSLKKYACKYCYGCASEVPRLHKQGCQKWKIF